MSAGVEELRAKYVAAMYSLADALMVPLELRSKKVSGSAVTVVQIGPFRLRVPVTAHGDVFEAGVVTVVAHVRGHLWAYLRADGRTKPAGLWLVVFNGGPKSADEFKFGSTRGALLGLAPLCVGAYQYYDDGVSAGWRHAELADLPTE